MVDIKHLVEEQHVRCVFREPNLEQRLIITIVGSEHIRTAMLGPEALQLAPGTQLYFDLMHHMAEGFEQCLRTGPKQP